MEEQSIVPYEPFKDVERILSNDPVFIQILNEGVSKNQDLDVEKRSQLLDIETAERVRFENISKIFGTQIADQEIELEHKTSESSGLKKQLRTRFSPEELLTYRKEHAFEILTTQERADKLSKRSREMAALFLQRRIPSTAISSSDTIPLDV